MPLKPEKRCNGYETSPKSFLSVFLPECSGAEYDLGLGEKKTCRSNRISYFTEARACCSLHEELKTTHIFPPIYTSIIVQFMLSNQANINKHPSQTWGVLYRKEGPSIFQKCLLNELQALMLSTQHNTHPIVSLGHKLI